MRVCYQHWLNCLTILTGKKNQYCSDHTSLSSIFSETQFETLWILTNVSSGTTHQTQAVVAAGAVPKLISLLQSKTAKVSDQAVWALGNIVGDGSYARDIAIANGVVEPILKMVHEGSQDALYRHNIAWLVSNLFRAKNPSMSFEVVQVLLPAVVSFLNDQNGIVVASACWSISYFTKEVSNVQAFINSGSLQKLVSLLDSQEESIVLPALRSIGHIVSGPDEHTDFTIKCNVLPRLASLLKASNGRICRDATWAISNIVSGTTAQIQKVIEAGVLPILIEVLDKSNCSCQHEAAWAITNITSKGTHEQIVFMVDQHQVLKPFCNLMTAMKVETVNVVLGGLLNILRLARSIGGLESLCIKMEEIEAVDKLESLLVHDNEDVYLKAFQIIDEFFEHNDDHEDVPTVAPRNDIDNCIFSPPGPGGDGFFNF